MIRRLSLNHPLSALKAAWIGHSRPPLLLLFMAAAIFSTPGHAQEKAIAIKGGKLLTITHGTIENGVVVMQGGKITAVGVANTVQVPDGAQVIDASGMTIYPGLIDSETTLGLTEISAEAMTNDMVELSDEIMPHMHTAEAFHAESALIPVARVSRFRKRFVGGRSSNSDRSSVTVSS